MINWKLRIKNVVFVLQVVFSALLPVLAYMGLTVEDFSSWSALGDAFVSAISSPYIIGLFIFNLWCAVNDPTTPGLGDSDRARKRERLGDD